MKRFGWKRLLLWVLGMYAAYVVLVSLVLHPYWAVTWPSGGRVLVVEGWMHEVGLKNAAALFADGGYDRVVVTGTRRPCAYYLRAGDTLEVAFDSGRSGHLEALIAGLPGEQWSLLTDQEPILSGIATKDVKTYRTEIGQTSSLRVIAQGAATVGHEPVVFIAGLRLNGSNLHERGSIVHIHHGDGSVDLGTPTFAHHGARLLIRFGVPDSALVILPTWRVERSKTYSAGRDMADWARRHRISSYDVATLSVHARRTWKMHRIAHGGEKGVGIVALDDPWCRRWTWWGNYYGWYQVLKETVALPAPWLVDRITTDEGGATAPTPP